MDEEDDGVLPKIAGEIKEVFNVIDIRRVINPDQTTWYRLEADNGKVVVSVRRAISNRYEVTVFLSADGEMEREYSGEEGSDAQIAFDGYTETWKRALSRLLNGKAGIRL